jgi:plasmid segregation protein ParM
MIAMIPFLFGVIGLAIGAFAAYTAGGKNRQAAKHYKKVANELSDKYTNLEKGYHQLTDENTKKIDELNQAREVIAQNTQIIDELTSRYDNLEQEYHQITDENKQHLDNLANYQQLITKNNQFISELNDKLGNLQKKYDELIAENTTQKELITEKTKIINELNDRYTNLQTEFEETASKNQQYLTDLNQCKQLINKNKQDINELTNKYSNLQKKYHQLTQENKQNIEKLSDAGELIAQKTKTIDELTDKYAKLEQEYHHLATENTKYIDAFTYDSDLVDLLVTFEKESVGFAVELHQSVISLMCEIHIEATEESIDELKSLVEEANQFLEEIKENLIIISDDYYETFLESVTNNNREPLSTSAFSLSTPVLSIDLGRTSTKVCVSREPGGVVFISAHVKQIPFADIFYGDIDKYRISLDPIDPLIDVWLEHQGSGYILGQMAAECGANLGVGQSKLEDALVKVLAAAGYFKLKDEISVVISLPFLSLEQFEIEKAQLVSMITGPHLFNFRGESVFLNITKVWIMPNGYGSLLWSETQPNKPTTMPDLKKICLAIIDIGYETIDMVMVDNFRFARGASKGEDFGMSKFYELIAHEIEGADSQSLRLIAAVNKPKGKRFYRPQDAWIATNLDDFLPNLTEQFSRETSARILAWLPERVTDVIITGGGGEFFWEDLQRLLKEARVNAYLTAPSRQANALGQYIYGEIQLSGSRAFRSEE